MIYYCNECEELIDESELKWRKAELEDSRRPWEKVASCPCCGSEEIEEAGECKICGTPISPYKDYCQDCVEFLCKAWMNLVEDVMSLRSINGSRNSTDYLNCEQAVLDWLEDTGVL